MTERDRWGLRGPVQSCRLQRTWYSGRCGGDLCKNEERGDTTIVEFRPDGSLARRWHHNPDGSESTSMFDWDASGRLVTVRTENSARPVDIQRYEYDTTGRLVRIVATASNGLERIAESYDYDEAGRKKKTLYTDLTIQGSHTHSSSGVEGSDLAYSAPPGTVTLTTLHNTLDQPTELLFHEMSGRALSRVAFVYDGAGHLLEEVQTILEEGLPPEMLTEKNPAQLEAMRGLLGTGAVPVRRLYQYDPQGRRVEIRTWLFGALGRYWTTMAYNDHGDQSNEISEHEQREFTIADNGRLLESPAAPRVRRCEARFQYDYDARNWIKKVVEARGGADRDFLVSNIEERTLAYYD